MNNIVALPWVNLRQAVHNATRKQKRAKSASRKPVIRPVERDAKRIHAFMQQTNGAYLMVGDAGGDMVTCWSGRPAELLWMIRQLEQVLVDGHEED